MQKVTHHRSGIAAAEELRKIVRTALAAVFGDFLASLPPALRNRAQVATNQLEQHTCRELAQSVSANTQRWIDTFVHQVDGRLIGGVPTERVQDPVGVDDAIALANIELRAEVRHRKAIEELDSRLDRIRLTLYVPIYTKALAPAALCRALQETADTLGWPTAQRRTLFETFEQTAVVELHKLYQSLSQALARIGEAAASLAREPQPEPQTGEAVGLKPMPVPDGAAELNFPKPAFKRPEVAPKVDENTLGMLASRAQSAAKNSYNDGSLAQDLLTLGENKPLPGVDQEQAFVPLQRMSLAGQFLNEAIADPFISKELRPQHEAVRFPLVKSALTDSTLFTAVTHPLRSLVNELMLKSATSRITGSAEARRMAELLQQVLVQFDLAPDFVRQAMINAAPIDEAQIRKFFEMQRQQSQERRDTVVNEAKRLVVREMEQRTFARSIPEAALRFLNVAWGPLLVKRLLQYGAGNPQYRAGLSLMDQLLDQIEDRDPQAPPSLSWRNLLRTMSDDLRNAGLSAERVDEAMAGIEAARQAPS